MLPKVMKALTLSDSPGLWPCALLCTRALVGDAVAHSMEEQNVMVREIQQHQV